MPTNPRRRDRFPARIARLLVLDAPGRERETARRPAQRPQGGCQQYGCDGAVPRACAPARMGSYRERPDHGAAGLLRRKCARSHPSGHASSRLLARASADATRVAQWCYRPTARTAGALSCTARRSLEKLSRLLASTADPHRASRIRRSPTRVARGGCSWIPTKAPQSSTRPSLARCLRM